MTAPARASLAATTRPAAAPRAARLRAAVDRLRRGVGRELIVFAAIGVVSTAAYAVLYLLFRAVVDAVTANALALVITAVGNTAANRRLTFGVRDGRSMLRDQLGGLAALGVALAITTAAVNALAVLAPDAGPALELAVLVTANVLATVARFALLRAWIGGGRRQAQAPLAVEPTPRSRS